MFTSRLAMPGGLFKKGDCKMKCGVRFCGGCNPKYDRGAAYEFIRQDLQEEIQFEYAQEDTIYDILLIVGGCTNCCASYDALSLLHISEPTRIGMRSYSVF